jgi:uncharacterized small protein (DUF1192 family)
LKLLACYEVRRRMAYLDAEDERIKSAGIEEGKSL